ncbi:hypothetical protein EDB82DRAFT_18087 [Fusarium venenatum]|uniref:uncharacterized protein n=1 Tax=Fusarium venenatum TaxID=56646 RepID=UPI001DF519CE|nr:hypothetical protein EDB82DRAFT_18087 [Fusarium venenatum]
MRLICCKTLLFFLCLSQPLHWRCIEARCRPARASLVRFVAQPSSRRWKSQSSQSTKEGLPWSRSPITNQVLPRIKLMSGDCLLLIL